MVKDKQKQVKDKKIILFKAVQRTVWGFERIFKEYKHSQDSGGVWAYVRQLSQREVLASKAENHVQTVQFIVVYSPKIDENLMIEFNQKTYKIESIDRFEFNKFDLKIIAVEVPPIVYDEVEWEEF